MHWLSPQNKVRRDGEEGGEQMKRHEGEGGERKSEKERESERDGQTSRQIQRSGS